MFVDLNAYGSNISKLGKFIVSGILFTDRNAQLLIVVTPLPKVIKSSRPVQRSMQPSPKRTTFETSIDFNFEQFLKPNTPKYVRF